MTYALVTSSTAPLFGGDNAQGEMISEAIQGEKLVCHAALGNFRRVVTPDNYMGWMETRHFRILSPEEVEQEGVRVQMLSLPLYVKPDCHGAPAQFIPFGAIVHLGKKADNGSVESVEVRMASNNVLYARAKSFSPPKKMTKENLAAFSQRFLGIPYVWGGRSSFGYDCSGFVQMLYNEIGVRLPRDAKDQITFPLLEEAKSPKPGDLVFFIRPSGSVTHVGLFLTDGKICHASMGGLFPSVQISAISEVCEAGGFASVAFLTTSDRQA